MTFVRNSARCSESRVEQSADESSESPDPHDRNLFRRTREEHGRDAEDESGVEGKADKKAADEAGRKSCDDDIMFKFINFCTP